MSFRDQTIETIARLASYALHERYIAGGTKDEYLLPSDLIEHLASVNRQARAPHYARFFQPHELAAMEALLSLEEHHRSWEDLEGGEAVHHNSDWQLIREAAAACLAAFGVDEADVDRLAFRP